MLEAKTKEGSSLFGQEKTVDWAHPNQPFLGGEVYDRPYLLQPAIKEENR